MPIPGTIMSILNPLERDFGNNTVGCFLGSLFNRTRVSNQDRRKFRSIRGESVVMNQ